MIVGHDWGAWVAWHAAQLHPLLPDYRGTALIDGVGHWTQQEAVPEFNEAPLGLLQTLR